jgi:hypothetical protein
VARSPSQSQIKTIAPVFTLRSASCEYVGVAFEVGSRVVAPLNRRRLTGVASGPLQPPRHGVIEEVLRSEPNPRYRIRWDAGGQSVYTPTDRGLRVEDDPAAS